MINDIAREIIEKCTRQNLTIACAESLTGGMLSSALVSVPGASSVFCQGIVSYSNDAKRRLLNVSEQTLDRYGAVSEQTAREMVCGLVSSNADILVSTTGLAGPTGDGVCDLVGLTFIGISFNGKIDAHRFIFSGDREQIRKSAVLTALTLINQLI